MSSVKRWKLPVAAALIATASAAGAASPVKFVMDWAFDGPQAIWTIAAQQACFSKQGLDLKIDRGFGSSDAIGKVAAGAYDIGVADFSSVIAYDAAHADAPLKIVFVVSDRSPTSVSVLKTSGIQKPKDLEGKRLADSQGEASRVLFPAFAKANGIDASKVKWVSVAPNLREASLLQGTADAAAGHMFTVLSGMKALNVEPARVLTMEYANYGVDVPGSSVIVRPQWAAAHKAELQSFLTCAASGIRASISDPKAALASLHQYNSLLDDPSEALALDFSTHYAILTPRVKQNGLSYVDPARYSQVLQQVSGALGATPPVLASIWDGAYLPPKAQLMVTAP